MFQLAFSLIFQTNVLSYYECLLLHSTTSLYYYFETTGFITCQLSAFCNLLLKKDSYFNSCSPHTDPSSDFSYPWFQNVCLIFINPSELFYQHHILFKLLIFHSCFSAFGFGFLRFCVFFFGWGIILGLEFRTSFLLSRHFTT